MPNFLYTALAADNAYRRGTLVARGLKQAHQELERQHLTVITIQREHRDTWFNRDLGQSVSLQEKILITRHLQTMLAAGIALDQSLKTLAEQTTNRRVKVVLADIERRTKSGQPFHQSLRQHPKYFSALYVNLIRVGEASGKLDQTLAYLLVQQENDYRLRTKIFNASLYPAIILTALIAMVTLMLVFVIPQIETVLGSYDVELPIQTKILLWLSRGLTSFWYLIVPALILLVLGIRWIFRTTRGKQAWDGFILKLPIVRQLVQEVNQAIITRTLTATLKSGLSLDQALELTLSVTGHTAYRDSLERGVRLVRRGVPFNEILRGSPDLYPPLTTRMIEVGEKSGQLDQMLEKLAEFYETSVETKLNNLSSIIEPLLILTVGLIAGYIAISVMAPIWSFSKTV